MRQMMEGVVVLPGGTGHKARLDGYSSGGKTGSAVIYDFATKRYTHTYNGSFIGFAPVTNPAIVISVTVNGTRGTAGYGGQAAAPVFKVVAEEALRVLDVPKDLPDGARGQKQPSTENTEDLAIADLADARPAKTEEERDHRAGPAGAQSTRFPRQDHARCAGRSVRHGAHGAGGRHRRGTRAGAPRRRGVARGSPHTGAVHEMSGGWQPELYYYVLVSRELRRKSGRASAPDGLSPSRTERPREPAAAPERPQPPSHA